MTRTAPHLRSAAFAVLALVATACGGSSAAPPQTSVAPSSPTSTAATAATAADAVSLGDREAGFGPGSAVFAAGTVLDRLGDLDSSKGPWTSEYQKLSYRALPAECGYQEPLAARLVSLFRVNVDDEPFADVINAEVHVYSDAGTAQAQVGLLNGATAQECDVAMIAMIEADELANPSPGVDFDFGDGIGSPLDGHTTIANSASRRYEGATAIGSQQRELEQVETSVAMGTMLVRLFAVSTHGIAEELSTEALALLVDGGALDTSPNDSIDAAVRTMRLAVLPDDTLPSYYEPAEGFQVLPPPPEVPGCYEGPLPEAHAYGPSWISISPGISVSGVHQVSRAYGTEAEAVAAFENLVAKGTDCFLTAINLPPDYFSEQSADQELMKIGDHEVVRFTIAMEQRLGNESFDVEFGLGATQLGKHIFVVNFGGITGDSPDLAELAAAAADRTRS